VAAAQIRVVAGPHRRQRTQTVTWAALTTWRRESSQHPRAPVPLSSLFLRVRAPDNRRHVRACVVLWRGVMCSLRHSYLKWMLLYEEPDNSTVWLAKALPRDWLAAGAEEVVVEDATTRYGRVSYRLSAKLDSGAYTVSANVTLPPSYGKSPPAGGMRLRLRAPKAYARKLKSVTIGGKPWSAIDAEAETIDFSPSALKASPDLSAIVATFGSSDE
jgi:hypothetical protein